VGTFDGFSVKKVGLELGSSVGIALGKLAVGVAVGRFDGFSVKKVGLELGSSLCAR